MREQTTGMRGHTPGWYERLARQQEGYYYPWESTTAEGGGEAAYAELVRQHLTPDRDVRYEGTCIINFRHTMTSGIHTTITKSCHRFRADPLVEIKSSECESGDPHVRQKVWFPEQPPRVGLV